MGDREKRGGVVLQKEMRFVVIFKTKEVTPHPVSGAPTFPHYERWLCLCAKVTAERRGLHCATHSHNKRHVHHDLRIFPLGVTQASCRNGRESRWHLRVVEMGSKQLGDVNNLNTLIPCVHHHTTTAAECNTVSILVLKFTVQ